MQLAGGHHTQTRSATTIVFTTFSAILPSGESLFKLLPKFPRGLCGLSPGGGQAPAPKATTGNSGRMVSRQLAPPSARVAPGAAGSVALGETAARESVWNFPFDPIGGVLQQV